jgi:hypothetical protein
MKQVSDKIRIKTNIIRENSNNLILNEIKISLYNKKIKDLWVDISISTGMSLKWRERILKD